MIATLFTSLALASVGIYAQELATPGRAIFWTPGNGQQMHEPVYQSQTTTVEQLSSFLTDKSVGKELLVVFCSEDQKSSGFFTQASVTSSVKKSEDATVFPYVYHALESAAQNICSEISSSSTGEIQTVSLAQIGSILSTKSEEIQNNGILESFLVNVPAADVDMVSSVISQIDSTKSLFVALSNPSSVAPTKKGNYRRILASDIADGINYLPEGTEFSIYKQNTYLYVTPDIFTGLMTFLFVFFVLLTGYRCLGAIQGPSTFASTLPALGKEG